MRLNASRALLRGFDDSFRAPPTPLTAQMSALNQQPWKELEEAVRTVARRSDVNGVYVVTGPLFERPTPRLPKADEPHMTPSGYFKIVILAERSSRRTSWT